VYKNSAIVGPFCTIPGVVPHDIDASAELKSSNSDPHCDQSTIATTDPQTACPLHCVQSAVGRCRSASSASKG